MILNKIYIEKNKNAVVCLKRTCITMFFFLLSITLNGQDSIAEAPDLNENKELEFQQFFFKALSEKSIGNYQKAIELLESCNQILQNNSTVFFEFSKNYLELNKTLLAKEYIERALQKDANNIWMLKHLVKVNARDRNFKEAIQTQQKIIETNPKEREYLVRLHLQNNDVKSALALMNTLESENALPSNLKSYKERLENRNKKKREIPTKKTEKLELATIISRFKTDKSFALLKQVLEGSIAKPDQLLQYSTEGITLFPAQPLVYFMNGKALILKQEYKKAISILKNGVDFVIEDAMEANFYNEIAKAYKALGNLSEEKKYLQKSKKLKG
ncbi:hypothetical protein [uncultured Polaribacter sp.]|uniref:tetratricopeptide repeat protein n=1 Tax=uncultured Polaribacter sp. TaxID=174711 RepID=UPI00261851E5|nr:hypothetical protein [uncultured Polaribacter sp.]